MSLEAEKAELAKAARQREINERHTAQDLLALYHITKGASELASRLVRNIGYLPEDERVDATNACLDIVDAFGRLNGLIADRGNNTPHEKGR